MRATLPTHDPKPVKRALMVRAARKLIGRCLECDRLLPLHPDTGNCWLCDNLNSPAYPLWSTDRQQCRRRTPCNDCAFRGDSPEAQTSPEDYAHLTMPCDSERSPESVRELLIAGAKRGGAIFWCHKPFLEPEQEWGYDATSRELTPLKGEHWEPCAGWAKVFWHTHGVKKEMVCQP